MGILKPIPLQKGFGLLEVLITIAVLGVALIALARLQALLLQGGSYAKARSVALNLAQGKLEDLRSFVWLKPPVPNAGIFTYVGIGDNTGGAAHHDGTLVNPSDMTVSNVAYHRTWKVIAYYYCPKEDSPGNSVLVSENNCDKPYSDFKIVKVMVKWNDLEGEQSVELASVISASDPAKEGRALVLLSNK